ncbi:MAG: hypothetical protein ACXVAG_05045 [Vulcanimicrobiaceae bacterium]
MRIALIFAMLFSQIGSQATSTLLHVFYAGNGLWRDCTAQTCHTENQDWGVDSLDYTLWLRWKTTGDASLPRIAAALVPTATEYPRACTGLPCNSWSDVPEWDAIADMREYEMLRDPQALSKARKAFAFVDDAKVFALGACPEIHYQLPMGQGNHLKTLETDANYIKAALLLYDGTHERRYLDAAVRQYAAVRMRFLDPAVPLYSVYVFDNGAQCTQVSHRFFASVNGDMVWSGIELARITSRDTYRAQALATAQAVETKLSDQRGIFADLQAENDVVEPLVEAMWLLATTEHQSFARSWILRNAAAALGERKPDGTYGRFFDGPIPENMTTAWQSNGGLALEIAAAALAPRETAVTSNDWAGAHYVARAVTALPATIVFDGSAIALIGAIGAQCCEPGHARIFIDGEETANGTGIWQNKSSSGKTLRNSVLFAWQWPSRERHTIRIEPGISNAKEGGPFISLTGYEMK